MRDMLYRRMIRAVWLCEWVLTTVVFSVTYFMFIAPDFGGGGQVHYTAGLLLPIVSFCLPVMVINPPPPRHASHLSLLLKLGEY